MDFQGGIPNIFIFYLIITSNFFVPLLPCKTQTLVQDSILMRHILGFLTMTFFVVIANKGSDTPTPFWKFFLLSFAFYAWFLVSTRMNHTMWSILLLLLASLYLLKLYKDQSDEKEKVQLENQLAPLEKGITWSAFAVTALGFLLYLGEKKVEYGKIFRYSDFFLGKVGCRGSSPTVNWSTALKKSFS